MEFIKALQAKGKLPPATVTGVVAAEEEARDDTQQVATPFTFNSMDSQHIDKFFQSYTKDTVESLSNMI